MRNTLRDYYPDEFNGINFQVLGAMTFPEDETRCENYDGLDQYKCFINRYDWNTTTAYNVMMCESSGRPDVNNFTHATRDNSWGLFQINIYGRLANTRPSAEWLKDPENNVEYAYQLYRQNGWKPWLNCARKHGAI